MMFLNKRLLIFIGKLIVVLVSFGFILYKFFTYNKVFDVLLEFKTFKINEFILLLIIGLLVFVNWLIESIKWKKLIEPIEEISLLKSYKAIFAGIPVSMFTPNRTGEFFGRVLVLEENKRIDGIAATIIGSFSQLIITILIGLISIGFLFLTEIILPQITVSWEFILIAFCILIIVAVLVYFNIHIITEFLLSFSYLKKINKYFKFMKRYTKSDLLKVLFISFLRYLVFVIQFFALFHVFHIEISFIHCFAGVGLMYFIMAVIPSFTITELGVRGSVAILVFEVFSANVMGILASSILLWLFNLAIPALIGAVVFYKMKI
jgi:Lysylphosphatidylglycerol synthase TM region